MPFNSITTLYPPGRGIGNGPRQRVEVVGPRVVARRAPPRPRPGRALRPPRGAGRGGGGRENGPGQGGEVVGPGVVARRASPRPGAGRAFRPPSGADAGRRSVPA